MLGVVGLEEGRGSWCSLGVVGVGGGMIENTSSQSQCKFDAVWIH